MWHNKRLDWDRSAYYDRWWRIRGLTSQTHIPSPSLFHVLLDCRAWGRRRYYRPSLPNSHSGLLSFRRMFMTYDFDPAFILRWGHIVVSYLALARARVCRSWHFSGRSFLIGRERMRAAEKPRCDEFPADRSCVALIARGAPLPGAAVVLRMQPGSPCSPLTPAVGSCCEENLNTDQSGRMPVSGLKCDWTSEQGARAALS